MDALIAKAASAATEQLMEMAILLNDVTAKEGVMSRMAVMVALEKRLGSEAFELFCNEMEA